MIARRLILLAAVAVLISGDQLLAQEQTGSVRTLEERVVDLTFRVQSFGRIREDTATNAKIVLDADVLFEFDKATLTPDARAILREISQEISNEAQGLVMIEGHTDSVGSDTYNQSLSERRAQTVRRSLERLVGQPGIRFSSNGFGERQPVADNSSPAGRRRNRRVEVTFSK